MHVNHPKTSSRDALPAVSYRHPHEWLVQFRFLRIGPVYFRPRGEGGVLYIGSNALQALLPVFFRRVSEKSHPLKSQSLYLRSSRNERPVLFTAAHHVVTTMQSITPIELALGLLAQGRVDPDGFRCDELPCRTV